MENKNIIRNYIIKILAVAFIAIIFAQSIMLIIEPQEIPSNDPYIFSIVPNHDPISINGNDELATFASNEGLIGNGTYASPYIIKGFIINASTAHGIEIRNTNAYLIIRGCTVAGGNSFNNYGMILCNVSNANIISNELIENSCGIILYNSSSNNTLSRNKVNYNGWGGISLWYNSSNNILSGNIVSYNEDIGITLSDSYNNTLSGNTVTYNIWIGIHFQWSNNNTLSGNIVSYNEDIGINLGGSYNNTLSGNTASYNGAGIFVDDSNYNTLSRNILNYNRGGILLSGQSNNNTIYHNDIYGNQNFQAYESDGCLNTKWDNGTLGNYWGNSYIIIYPDSTNDANVWDTPYEIDGNGIGSDHFPFVNSVYPNFEPPSFTDALEDVQEDFSVNENYSGLNITWNTVDLHPGTYIVELNGIENVSATSWTNEGAILYDIPEGLSEGDYIITIFVSDESGNTAHDTVIFTVISDIPTDGMEPKIKGFPLLNIIFFGSAGIFLMKRKLNNQRIRN